jgi:hypothetical protein
MTTGDRAKWIEHQPDCFGALLGLTGNPVSVIFKSLRNGFLNFDAFQAN